ncbi:MAG: carboxypeptidase-like regulatory domain-containing protein [Acidobacteriota bacterium]
MGTLLPLTVVAALIAGATLPGQIPANPPPSSTELALLAGQVVDATSSVPIGSVVVALNGSAGGNGRNAPRVLTDAQGRFFFSEVAAGSYTISATKPGWLPGALGRRRPGGQSVTLDIRAGDRRADLSIGLWRTGIVTGRVVDETGEPIPGVDVRVFQRTFVAGHPRWRFAVRAITDDRGTYRLATLTPGDYLVCVPATVNSTPSDLATGELSQTYLLTMTATGAAPMDFRPATTAVPGSDVRLSSILSFPGLPPASGAWTTFTTTYYPSANGMSDAAIIKVAAGRERTGVDIVVHAQPTWQVSGSVTSPDGSAAVNHAVHLLPADSADSPIVDAGTATTDSHGHFVFYGVPAGQYVVRVVRLPLSPGWRAGLCGGTGAIKSICIFSQSPETPPVADDPVLYVDQPVSVGGRNVTDLALTLRSGARVGGRAEFEGTAPAPTDAQWNNMRVTLDAADGRSSIPAGGFDNTPSGRFGADGTFKIPRSVPGRYLLRVAGVPSGWTLKGASLQGRDVAEQAFDLTQDTSDVVVTFTDHASKIEGAVQTGGAAQVTAVVLIFPTSTAGWTDYGQGGRRVNSTTARSGRFTLPAPPAGDYFLVAVADDDATDWQSPAFLAKAAAVADRVSVRDGAPLNHDLTLKRIP